jgi:bile acid-coenzyme A ligase
VSGPPAVEFVPMSRRIRDLAAARPDAPALTAVDTAGAERTLSWRELDGQSDQLARVLQNRGLALGERLALELRNSLELVLCVMAAWKTGAVPVPMRWDLPEWERSRLLDVVGPRVTVCAADLPDLVTTMHAQPGTPLPDVIGPQVNGICSSGSTGTPKIILSDRPAVWTPESSTPFASTWAPVPVPQTIVVPAPMYHTNGFATLLSLLGGDRLIVMEKFDAALLVDLVERHRATTFTATPTMLQRIARLPDIGSRDLSSVAWILQGAAVIPPALVHRWFELLSPTRVFMAYGMTEGLGLTALRGDEWLAHPGSVGRGFRGTEIRIAGPDGRELPPGEVGEIYLRSPTTGLYTYLGGAPLLPTTDDGFGTAGDLGSLDEDGYLYIADRRVDLIISGGANVYPAEVESALADHPAIADVVVVGLADAEWGRRVHAIIEPADPEQPPSYDDVVAYAKSKLAAYKVPKTVELVERIPRSAATKVSRSALVAERDG